jgi:ABC-type polysaccharide/polyol phosphate export permease
MSKSSAAATAVADIAAAIVNYSLVGMLGWQDVRQRYRRSALGPFWLTISMGVMIATIGIVFGQIFQTPMQEYLPFLTAGMIVWTLISAILTEGCAGFIAAEGIIKQLPIPLFVHIMRLVWRNLLIFAHNIVILPLSFLAVGKPFSWSMLIAVIGLALLVINLLWVSLVLGLLCARYRDLPQIIASILQVVFYLTPIMWMPSLLPKRAGLYMLDLNPFYHLLEIVRLPLLGQIPALIHWEVTGCLAIVGWCMAITIYGRYKRRIAYWL